MGENLTKFLDNLTDVLELDAASIPMTHKELAALIRAARTALASQPKPGAVPELPEWLELDEHEDWRVTFEGGHRFWIDPSLPPDDLERIAEACRILAARERARRAG